MKLRCQKNKFDRNFFTATCIMFAFLLVVTALASAQVQAGQRCDWAECKTESSVGADSDSAEAGNGANWKLRACEKEDKFACQDQCHGEFDQDYNRCLNNCLKERCSLEEPSNNSVESNSEGGALNEGVLCLMDKSNDCDVSCVNNEERAARARCRRDCLRQACPGARQDVVAQEAAAPGSVGCETCRAKFSMDCKRTCAAGLYSLPSGSYTGLQQLGCEKACEYASCGKSCSSIFGAL